MGSRPEKPRVLVVDDYEANRLAMEVILEYEFSVVLAESGAEALELTRQEEFAVILLDVRMPILDGFAVAAELRRRDTTRMIPIIFTSAFERSFPDRVHGGPAGTTDYLVSPFDPDQLKFKVRTYAQYYQHRKTLAAQVEQLHATLRGLRAELAKTSPHDAAMDAQVRSLEDYSRRLGGRIEEKRPR